MRAERRKAGRTVRDPAQSPSIFLIRRKNVRGIGVEGLVNKSLSERRDRYIIGGAYPSPSPSWILNLGSDSDLSLGLAESLGS